MKNAEFDIDAIVIESPCSVPWASMTGDDAKRFCGQCRLHVYDLSQMTRPEIRRLHAKTNGEFCKRVWRRPDGRVITKDCSRVMRAVRRRLRAIGTAAAGLLAVVGFLGCASRSACSRACGGRAPAARPDETAATPTPAPGTQAPKAPAPKAPEPDATVITGR